MACGAWTARASGELPRPGSWAKRQITWLRSMPQRQVVDCQADNAIEQVLNAIERLMVGEAQA